MDNILTKIKSREDELEVRYKRMRADMGLYFLDSFELKNKEGKAVKAARNVTLNDARVFPDRVIAVLSSAEPRVEVEGDNLPTDYESKVEDFWNHIVYDCNRRLLNRELGELHSTLVTQSVIEGWIVVRGWVWKEEDKAQFDILPCDPLGVSFLVGPDGLEWVAPKQERSKEAIEREYGETISGKIALVRDYWDREVNVVFVGSKKVKEEPSGLVPFVIHPVGSRPPMGRDARELTESHGESVYSANRHLYEVRNEIASIAHSLDYLIFRPPLGYASETGGKAPAEYPYDPETLTEMLTSDQWRELPIGQIKESILFLWSIVDPASQRGSLVYSEYGELGFELSAIAIEKLEAHRDQIFVPRLKALTATYRDLAHLLFDQFIALGLPAELGERGTKAQYSPSDFKQDFSVRFGMSTVSPEKKVASYAIAQAAQGILDKDTIRRDIVQVEKPEEVKAKLLEEEIYELSPMLKLSDFYDDLGKQIEEAEGDEKASLERKQKIVELTLAKLGAGQPARGRELPRREEPPPEAPPAQMMPAESQIEREAMRRKGLEREEV